MFIRSKGLRITLTLASDLHSSETIGFCHLKPLIVVRVNSKVNIPSKDTHNYIQDGARKIYYSFLKNLCVYGGGDGMFVVLLQFCKAQDGIEYAFTESAGVASDRHVLSRIKS